MSAIIIALTLTIGCKSASPTPSPMPPTRTSPPPTATPAPPTHTLLPPTATLRPTDTPLPTPTASKTRRAWIKTPGKSRNSLAFDLVQTADGGYLILGVTDYQGHRPNRRGDVYLIKSDPAGQVAWEKTYGGDLYDAGHAIIQAQDGGWLILGETESFGAGDADFLLIKIDPNGQELWSRTFGGPDNDFALEFQRTADGGIIMVGGREDMEGGDSDVYVVKCDALGNETWSQVYGSAYSEAAYAIHQTANGDFFILANVSYTEDDEDYDLYLLKIDALGHEIWSRTWNEPGKRAGHAMSPTSEGDYVIVGSHNPTGDDVGSDFMLLKINADGHVLWTRTFGDENASNYGRVITETPDGGYIIAGSSAQELYFQGSDIPIVKTDQEGEVVWTRLFNPGGHDAARAIVSSADGGYVVAGYSTDASRHANGLDDFRFVLIKLFKEAVE